MSDQKAAAGDTSTDRPEALSLLQASRYWFKLGWISFGGPAGQIAMMHQELVERRRWISERRFLHALNYCMLLPGPEAQQLATYIGWLMHGVRGGIVAGALFVLPSLLIMVGLSWAYLELGTKLSTDLLYGVKPAVVAIVLFAAWRIGGKVLRTSPAWIIAGLSLAGVLAGVPFPALVVLAAVAGWFLREQLGAAVSHAATHGQSSRALIDDDSPIPAHAGVDRRRLIACAAAGIGLAVAVYAGLLLHGGPDQVLTRMAAFFTQAALVTFGGAYAVMPYVFQQAVETYQWLTPAQMLDGLALGETTPGPLIMVVAFIGYVGAAGAQAGALTSGVAGACVATFFTFLPSFLFILLGGPLVERSREGFRLGGPLAAITAAVVGTIVYLGLALAQHVIWPLGYAAPPDVAALALSFAALLVLIRNKLGLIAVIVLSAALGAVYRFLLQEFS